MYVFVAILFISQVWCHPTRDEVQTKIEYDSRPGSDSRQGTTTYYGFSHTLQSPLQEGQTHYESHRYGPRQEYDQRRRPREVQKFQASDCLLYVEDEDEACRAAFPVFYWNHSTKTCEKTLYGGCHRTRNNFPTLEDCKRVATPLCS